MLRDGVFPPLDVVTEGLLRLRPYSDPGDTVALQHQVPADRGFIAMQPVLEFVDNPSSADIRMLGAATVCVLEVSGKPIFRVPLLAVPSPRPHPSLSPWWPSGFAILPAETVLLGVQWVARVALPRVVTVRLLLRGVWKEGLP